MASPKRPLVIRVSGIQASSSEQAENVLGDTIKANLLQGEKWQVSKVTIVPSCYYNDGRLYALITCTGLPNFLSSLKTSPRRERRLDNQMCFDTHFQGFTQLYPIKGTPQADLVFITGLGGHAYGSWASKDEPWQMWPRDLIQDDLPNVRTMTYGYEMSLLDLGAGDLMDYRREFSRLLEMTRSTSPERPIIFVAHSFGGNILKSCLRKDSGTLDRTLLRCTTGIMFFAVPHKGMDLEDMIAAAHGGASPPQVLHEIKQWRSELDSFRDIISEIAIVSFYETKLTRRLIKTPTGKLERSGEPFVTLDAESSTLGLSDREEVKIPIHADHSAIVKFSGRDTRYVLAVKYLREFALRRKTPDSNMPVVPGTLKGAAAAGDIDTVRMLLEEGAPIDDSDNNGWTPLASSAANGHTEVVRLLIRAGANVDKRDNDGSTPIKVAASKGHLDVVRILLAAGASKDLRSSNGWTALAASADNGHFEVVRALLTAGTNPNVADSKGWTPLMRAASHSNRDVVGTLILAGADVNARNNNGWSALRVAVKEGNTHIITALVAAQADLALKDSRGTTALRAAKGYGRPDVIDILKRAGAPYR